MPSSEIKISGIGGIPTRKILAQIGTYMVRAIQLRTSTGRDYQENTFNPYSKSYAAYRKEKGVSVGKVNLESPENHPHMMANLKVQKLDDTSVDVGFVGDFAERAAENEERGRIFLAVSEKDEKEIDDIIDKSIEL